MTAEQRLFDDPTSFQFFQAVFHLELLLDRADSPQRPDVEQLVRFKAWPELVFPASSVRMIRRRLRAIDKPHLFVPFLGLIGAQGALPLHYTLKVLEVRKHVREDDLYTSPLQEWLDLFNHRLLGLFYRAWEKYHFPVAFFHQARRVQRSAEATRLGRQVPDDFTQALLCLVGLGTPALRHRLTVETAPAGELLPRTLADVPDLMLLQYGGLLARRTRTHAGLVALLASYFNVPVEVQEFAGQWLQLQPESQTCFVDDGNCCLGENVVAGERTWDFNSLFRIRLGPLDYATFIRFLPDEAVDSPHKAFFLLSQIARYYAGAEFDFDVELRLRGNEVPECCFAEPVLGEMGPRLGWNTWLKADIMPDVVDGAIFPGDDRTRLAWGQHSVDS